MVHFDLAVLNCGAWIHGLNHLPLEPGWLLSTYAQLIGTEHVVPNSGFLSGSPNQEFGFPFLFKGLIIGT
jgi:hypothetical protein